MAIFTLDPEQLQALHDNGHISDDVFEQAMVMHNSQSDGETPPPGKGNTTQSGTTGTQDNMPPIPLGDAMDTAGAEAGIDPTPIAEQAQSSAQPDTNAPTPST